MPEFVNRYVLTDVYLSSIATPALRTPILPSITTLVNPLSSLIAISLRILRALFLVALSHLPGSQQAVKRISVANTAVLFHDGRALATCESGPPMRISLPGLETVGWFNGQRCEGEGARETSEGFGGVGMLSFMREWTTAHVRRKGSCHCEKDMVLTRHSSQGSTLRRPSCSSITQPSSLLTCNIP